MDPVELATILVQGQMAATQGKVAAAMLHQQKGMNDQIVSLVGAATQAAASVPSDGTGQIVNLIA